MYCAMAEVAEASPDLTIIGQGESFVAGWWLVPFALGLAVIAGLALVRWLGLGSSAQWRDPRTQEMLRIIMGRANIFLWSAKVTRSKTGLVWSYSILPESHSHSLCKLATHLDKGGLWDPGCLPEYEDVRRHAVQALEEGVQAYEQEFRIVEEEHVHWLKEEVGIKKEGRNSWRLMGIVTEVTSEVLAVEANRRNNNQFRSILERVDCMLWEATVVQLVDGSLDWTFEIPPSVLQRRIFRCAGALRTKRLFPKEFEVTQLSSIDVYGAEAIHSGAPGYEQEFKIVRKEDGKTFWLHEHASILQEAPGRWQLYGLMVDITSRHQALEARRESEQQLQQVLMRVDCMLWHAQVDLVSGGVYAWNIKALPSNMFYRLFECKPEAMVPRLWDVDTVPEFEALTRRSSAAFLENLPGYEQEFRFVRDGRTTWLREQVTIHPAGSGRWHVVGVAIDVTARRRAEAELAAEKERLAVTLRAMEEGVVTLDAQGLVQFMNRAAEVLFACDSARARGQPFEDICHMVNSGTGAEMELTLSEVFLKRQAIDLPMHCAVRGVDGKLVEVDGCCVPLQGPRLEVIGLVVVLRDMTDRRRLELQLQRATKLETLGILAGGIAHDFNNILTAIMGNIGLAQLEAGSNQGVTSYLGEAQGASERARDLTQQLLTFAKGGDPVRTAVFLPEVVQEIAQFAVRGSRVKCEFDMPADLWPANADKGQVAQIIQNLAINSLQAMAEGGSLRLSASNESVGAGSPLHLAAGDYVRLCVADTGGGIPAEVLPKIFDPYFTTKKHGSGLGLATVFSIIKKHRGCIDVESEPGKGTRFIIHLPALKERRADAVKTTGMAAPMPGGRVLIMDDEEPIRRLQERMLTRLGLQVDVSADGAEAVTKYQAAWRAGTPYDLLIMDLTVPGGIGGCEALAAIRGINPAVKAIVASGYSSDPVMANHERYGFCAVVVKPFNAKNLGAVVSEVLRSGPRKSRHPFEPTVRA